MDDETLITLVQQYELLYDLQNKDYSDISKKEKVWGAIGKEMNLQGSACKSRWFALRDQYRRFLKSRKTCSGQASSTKRKKFKFEDEMSFLKTFYQDRDTIASIANDLPAEDSFRLSENTEEEDNLSSINFDQVETNTETEAQTRVITEPEIVISPFRTTLVPQRRRKNLVSTETPSSILMKYIVDQNKEQNKAKDPIDIFFWSIAETVKKFPPMEQHLAKHKVFNAISEIEMSVLQNHLKTSTPIAQQHES